MEARGSAKARSRQWTGFGFPETPPLRSAHYNQAPVPKKKQFIPLTARMTAEMMEAPPINQYTDHSYLLYEELLFS